MTVFAQRLKKRFSLERDTSSGGSLTSRKQVSGQYAQRSTLKDRGGASNRLPIIGCFSHMVRPVLSDQYFCGFLQERQRRVSNHPTCGSQGSETCLMTLGRSEHAKSPSQSSVPALAASHWPAFFFCTAWRQRPMRRKLRVHARAQRGLLDIQVFFADIAKRSVADPFKERLA